MLIRILSGSIRNTIRYDNFLVILWKFNNCLVSLILLWRSIQIVIVLYAFDEICRQKQFNLIYFFYIHDLFLNNFAFTIIESLVLTKDSFGLFTSYF